MKKLVTKGQTVTDRKGLNGKAQRTGKQNEGGNLGWLPFALSYILEHLIIAVKCSADIVSRALQKGDEVKGNYPLGKKPFLCCYTTN